MIWTALYGTVITRSPKARWMRSKLPGATATKCFPIQAGARPKYRKSFPEQEGQLVLFAGKNARVLFLTVEAITKEEVPFILKALMKTSHYDPKRPLPDGITLTFITPPQSGASMIGEMTQTAYDKGRAVDALKAFFQIMIRSCSAIRKTTFPCWRRLISA